MCHWSLGEFAELEEILLDGYSMNISAPSYDPHKLFRSIHNLYVYCFNKNIKKAALFDELISEDLKNITMPPLFQREWLFLSAVPSEILV
jgi:hypothetical protein